MDDQFEKLIKQRHQDCLTTKEEQNLENDIKSIIMTIQVMKNWVMREFMTDEDENS